MLKKIKLIGKQALCKILESQVKQLRDKNDFKIVAVVGSVGKTSTKLAVARALGHKIRVIYQDGNYNDRVTVPLVLFGHQEPAIFNVFAWLKIIANNRQQLQHQYPYDVAVLELGTDGPGQLIEFAYLQPEITIVTAIADEHMEYFGTIDAVANEELEPLSYSLDGLINMDDVAPEYLLQASNISYYGTGLLAPYRIVERKQHELMGQTVSMLLKNTPITVRISLHGETGAKAALAAAATANMLGWDSKDIIAGLQKIQPVAGRMQVLAGQHKSTLIDDTYNASPIAVKAALNTLYSLKATQRIAILGSMNELGDASPEAHAQVGAYCDPEKLDLVVTIGEPAQLHLAPSAQAVGCIVKSFVSPYDAGIFVLDQLKSGGIVLAKGSQNGVFAEEALKALLAKPSDRSKLVRQSKNWIEVKARQFPSKE